MRILITGATGLIGKEVVKACTLRNIEVHYLTTSKEKIKNTDKVKGFFWDPVEGVIDDQCFNGVTAIIHLAGVAIGKKWTEGYKQKIITSRTLSLSCIYNSLVKLKGHAVKHLISASAIGVYPDSLTNFYNEEEAAIDNSFVGNVVERWENSADGFIMLGMKVSKIRTGLVLSKEGGMLPPFIKAVNSFVGAPVASGKQWQSWIHIEDIAGIYMHVLLNGLEGVYNAVAPNPVTNKKMTKEIGNLLRKPIWPFNIPKLLLKIVLGEMSYLLYSGQRVDSSKIQSEGYQFKYPNLTIALENVLLNKSDSL